MAAATVIERIWSSKTSRLDWCFEGEPTDGIVAVSSVGTQNNTETARAFECGWEEAVKKLRPAQILWYGRCPEKYDWNVTKIKPHYDEIVERRTVKNGRKRK